MTLPSFAQGVAAVTVPSSASLHSFVVALGQDLLGGGAQEQGGSLRESASGGTAPVAQYISFGSPAQVGEAEPLGVRGALRGLVQATPHEWEADRKH